MKYLKTYEGVRSALREYIKNFVDLIMIFLNDYCSKNDFKNVTIESSTSAMIEYDDTVSFIWIHIQLNDDNTEITIEKDINDEPLNKMFINFEKFIKPLIIREEDVPETRDSKCPCTKYLLPIDFFERVKKQMTAKRFDL